MRPFHVKDEDKPMIDKEMQSLVHIGISKYMPPYSSPMLLNARRNSSLKELAQVF